MSQLEFLRSTVFPSRLDYLKRLDSVLTNWSNQSPENARRAQERIFGVENSIKALTGYEAGLQEQRLMATKQDEENRMKQYVASDPKRKAEFGDPWATVAQAVQTYGQFFRPFRFIEEREGFPGDLNKFARILVRGAAQKQLPNAQRLAVYRESALPSLEQQLFSTAPLYKDMETVQFAAALEYMQSKLGADNPAVKKVINDGRTPAEAAKYYIENTHLDNPALRKQLWEGGEKAIEASTDPLIVMMREIEPEAYGLRKRFDDQVEAPENSAGAKLAKILFAQEGTNTYPDATFTLRLSFGIVAGYTENGQGTVPAGTKLPYFTDMGGAFKHAADHNNQPPYNLPESWISAKPRLKLSTALNVVETADIIGGNSGSPVVNKQGEVVGIIFDGNIQSLPWFFVYDDKIGRSIQVDTRGIIEALHTIYHADRLVNELMGTTAKSATTQ